MILVDSYTPIFVLVINPTSTSLCLLQWRLTLDAMKMGGMELPRKSSEYKD